MEAGHRCAIPTCQQIPVEAAHIVPWAQVQEHRFENLIALCPTCHTRYDTGLIDRPSMLLYKANLSILSRRYGELEQRVLRWFAKEPQATHIKMFGGLDILLMNLLEDGLLRDTETPSGAVISGIPMTKVYELTTTGREFIHRWLGPRELE